MIKFLVLTDIIIGLIVAYLSFWLYEIGNWISLSVFGASPSLSFSGILPIGVMATTVGGNGFIWAKLLQVSLCVCLTVASFIAVRKKDLPFTSMTLLGVTGMFLSSVYWEALSMTSFLPLLLHEAIYVMLSLLAMVGIAKMIPRLLQAGLSGK